MYHDHLIFYQECFREVVIYGHVEGYFVVLWYQITPKGVSICTLPVTYVNVDKIPFLYISDEFLYTFWAHRIESGPSKSLYIKPA